MFNIRNNLYVNTIILRGGIFPFAEHETNKMYIRSILRTCQVVTVENCVDDANFRTCYSYCSENLCNDQVQRLFQLTFFVKNLGYEYTIENPFVFLFWYFLQCSFSYIKLKFYFLFRMRVEKTANLYRGKMVMAAEGVNLGVRKHWGQGGSWHYPWPWL